MTDIWQYFQQLFQKVEQSSKTEPVLHDPIIRSQEALADYKQWNNSFVKTQLFHWLKTEYTSFLKEGISSDGSIVFLDEVSAKGFAIYFSRLRYSPKEVTYFFDSLKDKILELNYKSYSSDRQTYTQKTIVESTARHYLKPSLKNMLGTPPFNQEFGNISIELICQDDLPKTLKFSCTSYHGRSYQKPKRFEVLMKYLLSPNK